MPFLTSAVPAHRLHSEPDIGLPFGLAVEPPVSRHLSMSKCLAVRAGRGLEGADRGRGGAADRRAVRDRARDQRQARRGAPGGPGGAGRAAGGPAGGRVAVGKERAEPLVAELEAWLRVQHERVSPKSEVGKAIAYALNHWK